MNTSRNERDDTSRRGSRQGQIRNSKPSKKNAYFSLPFSSKKEGRYGSRRLRSKGAAEREEKEFENHLKALKMQERAFRSSKRRMFHRIPEGWGSSIRCDEAPSETDKFVVALASDEQDPLPIFAAINSTLSNAAEPNKLSFVIVVTKSARNGLQNLVRRYVTGEKPPALPVTGSTDETSGIPLSSATATDDAQTRTRPRVSICVGLEEQLRNRPAMKALAALGNSTRVKRKELLSSFNFAAFYMPHFLKNERILYLDSDVVVRADVGELADMAMNDMPAAAVEDCTQRISKYIDFGLAGSYRRAARIRVENLWREGCSGGPSFPITASSSAAAIESQQQQQQQQTMNSSLVPHCEPAPRVLPPNSSCVFNRGVLVLNRAVWLREHLAEHIERHVIDYVHSRGALFRSGVSQPPFLVALATQYQKLPGEWNVRGLGRDAIGGPEWHVIAHQTRHAYPKFVDIERDLDEYMRAVAKVRLHEDELGGGIPIDIHPPGTGRSTSSKSKSLFAGLSDFAHLSDRAAATATHIQHAASHNWRTRILLPHTAESSTTATNSNTLDTNSHHHHSSSSAHMITSSSGPPPAFTKANSDVPSENVKKNANPFLTSLDAAHEITHRGAASAEKYKNHYPYVCPYAAHAKILHFNGEVKPWRMPAATVTHVTPSEGALCLWRDVSESGPGHRRLHPDDYCTGDSVAECMSSCALDWFRYVAGHIDYLRREEEAPSTPTR